MCGEVKLSKSFRLSKHILYNLVTLTSCLYLCITVNIDGDINIFI